MTLTETLNKRFTTLRDDVVKEIKAMKNITENNKLIAEFIELPSHANSKGTIYTRLNEITGETEFLTAEDLNFERSWDWLIPVVEKARECQLFGSQRLIDNIDKRLIKLDLIATYRNVLDFIEWYNEQNK